MNAVWISWDDHRRSRELARRLGIQFQVIPRSRLPLVGTLVNMLRTIHACATTQAATVVVQNPSLWLTTIASFFKEHRKFRLVQDLHSYFSLHIHDGHGLRGTVYRVLSRYCIRRADVTVVTNPELRDIVNMYGGRGFVLQDAIPDLRRHILGSPAKRGGVVFVCTYSPDEPVKEVIEAARILGSETTIYVTGRVPQEVRSWPLPAGITLTGFLAEQDYLALLEGADAVLVLSNQGYTLMCGAYEGLAFKKPLVLSDTTTLRSYFGDEMVYVDNTAASIAAGIRRVYADKPMYDVASATTAERLEVDWRTRFREFMACVAGQPSGL